MVVSRCWVLSHLCSEPTAGPTQVEGEGHPTWRVGEFSRGPGSLHMLGWGGRPSTRGTGSPVPARLQVSAALSHVPGHPHRDSTAGPGWPPCQQPMHRSLQLQDLQKGPSQHHCGAGPQLQDPAEHPALSVRSAFQVRLWR